MECLTTSDAIIKFCEMLVDMDIQDFVSDNRISDICILTSSVNPIRLKNNPMELDEMAILTLYDKIVK